MENKLDASHVAAIFGAEVDTLHSAVRAMKSSSDVKEKKKVRKRIFRYKFHPPVPSTRTLSIQPPSAKWMGEGI